MSVVDTNGEWPGVLWRQKPILRVIHARIPTSRLISLGHAAQTASRANSMFQNTNTNLENATGAKNINCDSPSWAWCRRSPSLIQFSDGLKSFSSQTFREDVGPLQLGVNLGNRNRSIFHIGFRGHDGCVCGFHLGPKPVPLVV